MMLKIRKIVHHVDEVWIEGGKPAQVPLRMAAVAVVLRNPWAGRGFVEDLDPEIHAIAPALGELMVPRLLGLMADRPVEAYGKSALVGLDGEVEHGCALIHTLRFGNYLREAVAGKAFIPSTNKVSAPDGSITMPLKHKDQDGARSHFLSMEFSIPDAPRPDEIVVVLGVSDGGRPHQRIGDRYKDMSDLDVDQTRVGARA